jgi:hypothetical protein
VFGREQSVTAFVGERAVRSHSFVIALPVERAFALFEPEGERLWAEDWDPTPVHPADGHAQAGMVFTTGYGNDFTLWTMTRHDPAGGMVEYARVTPASRVAMVMVQCAPGEEGTTRVTVVYTYTGLNEAGNEYVRAMDEARYRAYIDSWQAAIQAALPRVK